MFKLFYCIKSYVSKVKSLVANVDIANKLKSTQSVDIMPTPIDSTTVYILLKIYCFKRNDS